MKILIHGRGRIGEELVKLVENGFRDSRLEGIRGRDLKDFEGNPDCIIDFSNHEAINSLIDFGLERKLPIVIGTTGYSQEELDYIYQASKTIPIFLSANMSLGVAILVDLAKKTVSMMKDANIEIVEIHHNRKLDSPSGTALMLANEIKSLRPDLTFNLGRSGNQKRSDNEIGIHSIRMGNVVGQHEVIVGSDSQTISLKHEAHSRSLFAEGAIIAADFLIKQGPGLYTMKDLISRE